MTFYPGSHIRDPTLGSVMRSLGEDDRSCDREDDSWLKSRTSERVYFLRAPTLNLIKIGYTGNLRRRMENFENTYPFPVKLIGTIAGGRYAERVMHERFARFHVKAEWFDETAFPEIIDVLVDEAEWQGKPEFAIYLQSAKI